MKINTTEPQYICPNCSRKIMKSSFDHMINREQESGNLGYFIPVCGCGIKWTKFEKEADEDT